MISLFFNEAKAQKFFNLKADNFTIDSILPRFTHSFNLEGNFLDSVYTVKVLYPEYIPMSKEIKEKYDLLTNSTQYLLPNVTSNVVIERKKGKLEVSFVPIVMKEDKLQYIVSFMIKIESKAKNNARYVKGVNNKVSPAERYAKKSVLAEGKWAKIRVPNTGIYRITPAIIKRAGFKDITKIRVYGYGGALLNERLEEADLIEKDDLKEVPQLLKNNTIYINAQGSISWINKDSEKRTRNPYSDYGYYFITESDNDSKKIDEQSIMNNYMNDNFAYHKLYEVDNYAWYHSGRNLYDSEVIAKGTQRKYEFDIPQNSKNGKLRVELTGKEAFSANVSFNATPDILVSGYVSAYAQAASGGITKNISFENNQKGKAIVVITAPSNTDLHLDFIDIYHDAPNAITQINETNTPEVEYVHNITNQNLHSHSNVDMVIIIPTTQKQRKQAERLKSFHNEEGMTVEILPADELYNEFSSGTPDAGAYRKYLKMLYDRAQNEDECPKYLVLFGDCAWDNRMLSSSWKGLNPDDFLLSFQSENSLSTVDSYINEGWFCLLDDGEGVNVLSVDKEDMAVGRFPVRNEEQAKTMVDKTINYAKNINAGDWQNTLAFLGDDGDANVHMKDVNSVADLIINKQPQYIVKKIMWDAYQRITTSTGNNYPDVVKDIKKLNEEGVLIFDYAGHGRADQISHENVLTLGDFQTFQNKNMPLWVTASCDIMPFDNNAACIGEEALFNKKGGAMAFVGTTRTVFTHYNAYLNKAFINNVLSYVNEKPITIGEALRITKNEMITTGLDKTENRLHYNLIGDPALSLKLPEASIIVKEINGIKVDNTQQIQLKAGSIAKIKGQIYKDNSVVENYNGLVTATIRDVEETITCRRNDEELIKYNISAFTFKNRTKTIFNGSDSIKNGQFTITFAVPRDITYSNEKCMINLYAINNDKTLAANGMNNDIFMNGTQENENNGVGPSVYCYLNSPSFTNGDNVNRAPYFVANIKDEDGINASGTGIGHDMELIIDENSSMTYNLNNNFRFDFGSYKMGSTYYNLPILTIGTHKLKFRVWDILNNSSETELTFNVVDGLQPDILGVSCSKNPAKENTTFIINHNRIGCDINAGIEIYDASGRLLWKKMESINTQNATYTMEWDLTIDNGQQLQTGVYVYRAIVNCDGSSNASKPGKLIVVR